MVNKGRKGRGMKKGGGALRRVEIGSERRVKMGVTAC